MRCEFHSENISGQTTSSFVSRTFGLVAEGYGGVAGWVLSLFLLCFSHGTQGADAREDGLSSMEWHPDFQVIQAAREPIVIDPVDLEFDEFGNAYVLELGGYPIAPETESQFPGRIVILSDQDQDGVFDSRKVFADRFQYATSILPYRGGLLVASPPDLLLLRDTDGDQVADERTVLMTGFAVGNAQHNYNGLIYGLDNWIYAGSGGNSGRIHWLSDPEQKMNLSRRDFRFRVESREIDFLCRTTSGFGIALDDWGHIFTTHNMRHIHHLVFPDRYLARNPYLSGPAIQEIADHLTDGLGRIYPIGVQEARVNHPEQSGFFSGACGITYYGGGAFPGIFNGNMFVTDVVLNLVHRDVLREDGPSFSASRGREKVEFLASRDRSFRPVNISVGPDGALYVLDFYRRVIEHPEWIPDELEKDMDLNAGKEKGRIYKITPKSGLHARKVSFPRGDLQLVVEHLSDANKWWRDTAQRLLVEWNDVRSVPLLENVVNNSPNARARVHALWTLSGMGGTMDHSSHVGRLSIEVLENGLKDPVSGVRENAVLIAEDQLTDSPELLPSVLKLTDDPSARVRMQVALTIGAWNSSADESVAETVRGALLRILEKDLENEWTRTAVLTGLGNQPFETWTAFLTARTRIENGKRDLIWTDGASNFANAISEFVGADDGGTLAALRWLRTHPDVVEYGGLAILDGVRSGFSKSSNREGLTQAHRDEVSAILRELEREKSPEFLRSIWSLASALGVRATESLKASLHNAAEFAVDGEKSLSDRLSQLKLLELSDTGEFEELLFELLSHRHPKEIQEESIRQLSRSREPRIAKRLVETWPDLGPGTRSVTGDLLLYRFENHDLLLTSVENGKIPMGQLNLHLERRRQLLRASNSETRRRASALFTDAGVVTRAEAMKKMQPALTLEGTADKGKTLFDNLCVTCHIISGNGNSVGPDLTDIYRKSGETLLHDVLDPNAAVDMEYLSFTAETSDGEMTTGLLISETEEFVTFREAGGKTTTLPRQQIERLTSSGLSFMPEELEAGLSQQDMADLISFLQQPR